MKPASILVLVDGSPHSQGALKTALAAGKTFSSYVEVMHVEPPPEAGIPVMGEGLSGPVIQRMIESAQARARRKTNAAKLLFRTHCIDAGIPIATGAGQAKPARFSAGWWQTVGDEQTVLVRRGRLFDLIVLARPAEKEGGVDAASLQAALFDTGRPVLISSKKASAGLGRSVVVAWDGSREAARSVSASLAFFEKAKKLTVVTIAEGRSPPDATELAEHLRLYGAKAKAVSAKLGKRKVGKALLSEAKRAGADLLVMGAYGHSVLREIVFGGATRDILRASTIPVLMAH